MTAPETRQFRRATARANRKRETAKVWGKHHKPYRRPLEMFKGIAAVHAEAQLYAGTPLLYALTLAEGLRKLGTYRSRGHGNGSRWTPGTNVAAMKRAAMKRRNVLRAKGQFRAAVR